MNAFDIAVIVIISFCLIRGLFNGVIGELSGIIGVIAAFYGAYTYYPMITSYAADMVQNPETRNLIAFSLLFCGILIVVGFISIVIRKFLKFVFLGWVDRILGLFFGAAKGILFASVFFILLTTFLPKSSSVLADSKFSPNVAQVSEIMTIFVSTETKEDFQKQMKGLYKKWKQ